MEVSQESFERFQKNAQNLQQKIVELTTDLVKASQTITEQASLIQHLSEDNLKLVAKLDALTGKKAPGTTFSA
jgi:chromosome segregation ATPase